ncbi:MAG: hypothetical protein ACK47B_01785 [Armatimonadota bacterium]
MLSLKLSARTQQYLAVGMPLAALAISLLVVFPTWTRYQSVTRRADTLAMELGELKAAAMPPRHEQLAAADDTEAEPSQFLGDLATLAAATGCELSGMDLATPATADAKSAAVLKPVLTKVQIKGTYRQIRAFIYQTRRAPRLYTITELSLRGEPGRDVGGDRIRRLLAMLTIERYVTPPEGVTAAPAPPAA